MRRGLNPAGDLVFVKRLAKGETIETVDLNGKRGEACIGKVLAVGPGRPLPNGSFLKPDVRKGDIVYFGHTTGVDMNLAGATVVVMRSEDILGVET